MANPTMTLIASNTVGSGGVSSVTFSSIPSTYTDLLVKISVRSNGSGNLDAGYMRFNGDTTSTYTSKNLYGNSSSTFSTSSSATYFYLPFAPESSATASTFSNSEMYIPNYTSSNYKSISVDVTSENNSATADYSDVQIFAGLWPSTSAITSLVIGPWVGSAFVQYSTIYLYGISNS